MAFSALKTWVNEEILTHTDLNAEFANVYNNGQPLDATLTALAGLTTVADRLIYATAADVFTTATLTAFARTLLDDAAASNARSTLGFTDPIIDKDAPGTIGGTTPGSGAFTTLSSSGAATLNSAVITTSATVGTTLGVTGASTLAALTCTTLGCTVFTSNGINDDAASEAMRIDSSGRVGIGLTPTANMAGISVESGLLTLKETTTPTADTNYAKVYSKNDNELYFQDGAGVEHTLLISSPTAASIKTGTYTGDGSISQGITGVGFQPTYVKIWPRNTTPGAVTNYYETTDTIVDDNASGMAFLGAGDDGTANTLVANAIISLDADGFTVDDAGVDSNPNQNTTVYNYICLG